MTTNRPKPPLRDYVPIINRFLERLETPSDLRFDEPGVAFYLANLRQLIEQKDAAADVRVVMFYANWILHSSLDHARTTGSLLERVCRAIIEHLDETTNASDEISRSVGFDILRDQIKTLKLGVTAKLNFKTNFEIVKIIGSLKPNVKFSNEKPSWRMIPVLRRRNV